MWNQAFLCDSNYKDSQSGFFTSLLVSDVTLTPNCIADSDGVITTESASVIQRVMTFDSFDFSRADPIHQLLS